ncbi:CRAL-TRIO domain-containing protein [Pseudomassariella vexata]|uniref:CRAL-TRIO domain-containing protein n=1 Tax=Pseudomassariella vexata TaxID=1141098 RepID=A0A1Y2EL00_9PEZI|nr:CRAL-TRIO domain-containing protein [Pseudomassariella vexata]ORY71535.1 CRAL-TRIO domain-containing protein [Pseudomassariella vexata]
MSQQIPEGHVGCLNFEQEKKLQEAWLQLGAICGVLPPQGIDVSRIKTSTVDGATDDNDKYGQTKEFQQYLAEEPPEGIRKTIWSMTKCDHPDSLVLRFLRARKWHVNKAIIMLVSTIKWRQDMRIEDNVTLQGEAVALKESMTDDENGFMLQYRSGKSYVRGLDLHYRPVYIVKARLHNPSAQSDKAMETYILHTIESIRVLVRDPYDTACLIFDLTGFGLKNMDFAAVRFIVNVFEARYPETLGVVLVHNAPYIFQGIWKIIKGWLDPVVAAKIVFTRSTADLTKYIASKSLQVEYGGDESWEYRYVEPNPGENGKLDDHDARDKIQAERDEIIHMFETATAEWVLLDPETQAAKEVASKRAELAEKLRVNYWQLDPYIRARTFYDRIGVLDQDGKVNFAKAA